MIQGKNKWGEFMKYKLFALIFIISIISCDKPEDLIDSADVVDTRVDDITGNTFYYKVKNYGTSNIVGWHIKIEFWLVDTYGEDRYIYSEHTKSERLEPGERSNSYSLYANHNINVSRRYFPSVVEFEPEFE